MTNPSVEEVADEEDGNVGAGTGGGGEIEAKTDIDGENSSGGSSAVSNAKETEDKETTIEVDSGRDTNSASEEGEALVPGVTEKMDEDELVESPDAGNASGQSPENPEVDLESDGGMRASLQENESGSDSEVDESLNAGSSQEEVPAKKRKTEHYAAGIKAIKHYQELKRTLEPFVQKKPCEKLKYQLGKCMECRNPMQGRKGREKALCRFLYFRKLRYTSGGSITRAGFLNPSDCSDEDVKLWSPYAPPADMNVEFAEYLLKEVGDYFCCLVRQEERTFNLWKEGKSEDSVIWRKTVQDLRELCDVCSTTLFNYHWTCGKCGFVACVDCFKTRREKEEKQAQDENGDPSLCRTSSGDEYRDSFMWRKCHRTSHVLSEMMLTQIIAKDALNELNNLVHQLRHKLKINQRCDCPLSRPGTLPPLNLDEYKRIVSNCKQSSLEQELSQQNPPLIESDSKVSCEPVAGEQENGNLKENNPDVVASIAQDVESTSDKENNDNDQDGLLDLFDAANSDSDDNEENNEIATGDNIEEAIVENSQSTNTNESLSSCDVAISAHAEPELKNFVRKSRLIDYAIKSLPREAFVSSESSTRFPDVKHRWLCQGNLLRLLEPVNPKNLKLFQELWKRGQPVLVSDVASMLDNNLWTPESFSRDFGSMSNDLINCMTGKVVPKQKIKKFWDGFECVKARLKDEGGYPMLLKLKDWPAKQDFAQVSPERFADLMKALPLGEYTYRDGMLNLASRLPDMFCKPDLGPKMYIAYGSGLHLDKGTTNLHLDISDAVNVMVYVGKVKDEDLTEHDKAVVQAIEESDCDDATIRRVLKQKDLPGALWHIWEARDADKIRDMCNKILIEKGVKVERHNDAIHDQSWYLDRDLRRRLMEEYNVRGYPIIQCAGDAVFIPAGAPHQVRNLNNCIKIAEDFVSPENVGHCFNLTEEFRNLTETHTNREDKLQIKNIVYHTIKDAVAVILSSS